MPINSREKGARAERELRKLLIASFPHRAEEIRRNYDQSAYGGHDMIGLPLFAPECKHVADQQWSLAQYWRQTVTQSERIGATPVLFRKQSLRGWSVYIHLSYLCTDYAHIPNADVAYVANITYDAFVLYARAAGV